MNGWLAATDLALAAVVAYDRYLLYRLLRDARLRTAPTPRKPPAAIEAPR